MAASPALGERDLVMAEAERRRPAGEHAALDLEQRRQHVLDAERVRDRDRSRRVQGVVAARHRQHDIRNLIGVVSLAISDHDLEFRAAAHRREIDQPGIGKVRVGGSPLAFSAMDRDDPRPAPVLGEHTEQILAEELGMSSSEIASLRDRGVVAGPA